MTALYNLCPHELRFYLPDGKVVVMASLGSLRLKSSPQQKLTGIKMDDALVPTITPQDFVGIDGDPVVLALWETNPNADFIVSLPAAQWLAAHKHHVGHRGLLCPATGPQYAVRDEKGVIQGARALERYA